MCGIVAIKSKKKVAATLYDCLIQLQHRGQDSAGILTADTRFHIKRGKGLVRDIFNLENVLPLSGEMGIAHVRYPTSGGHSEAEVQPFWVGSPYGISLAHNGNLTNHKSLCTELMTTRRRHLNTDSDSEVLLHLFADGFAHFDPVDSSSDFFTQICESVKQIFDNAKGSYAVVSCILGKGLVAFRDPMGIRPLVMGQSEDGIIFSSEATPFFSVGYELVGNVKPGEVVFVDEENQIHRKILMEKPFHPCVFEYVYFARPDTLLDDVSVYRARLRMGQNLAKRWHEKYPDITPDIVIPVPFSSNTAALSFAHEIGVRYSEGLYKNPFIGRTFIMPDAGTRKRSVRYKLSPQETEIRGKKVLLLDDSIVRGTTSQEIVKMVRENGAKEVYFVSACPPVKNPCYYGIDIPTRQELLGAKKSIDEIQTYLNVDALLYQNETDLVEAVTRKGAHNIESPCMACLNGHYVCGEKTMNILLVGSGAREHALAKTLRNNPCARIFCFASNRNPGILALAEDLTVGSVTDAKAICDYAKKHQIDFAIVGPEAPLEAGVVDALQAINIKSVGPTTDHAQIESSKGFTRDLMQEFNIPGQPAYRRFESYTDDAGLFLSQLSGNYVIKADGLCGGKGVVVSGEHLNGIEEGVAYCQNLGSPFVIEEKLVGPEFSLISFCDGEHLAHMPVVQDHKRAFVGDTGPNTGGMGSYSDNDHAMPFLSDEDIQAAQKLNELTARALKAKFGTGYKGFLYGGFMKTPTGVKLIEYNARLGDPEAINLLGLLETDLTDLCQALVNGTLNKVDVTFKSLASVCKYVVPEGYPTDSVKGKSVDVSAVSHPQNLYFAAIDQQDDQMIMTGSRAIAVLGLGPTIAEAEQQAERLCQQIKGPVFHRPDIGTAELIEKRLEMVEA